MTDRRELPAWALTALGIIGMVVLAAMGKPIPEPLTIVTGLAGGAGAGLTVPQKGNTP